MCLRRIVPCIHVGSSKMDALIRVWIKRVMRTEFGGIAATSSVVQPWTSTWCSLLSMSLILIQSYMMARYVGQSVVLSSRTHGEQ